MLSSCSASCMLYSAGSSVKRVHVVLSEFVGIVCVHVCTLWNATFDRIEPGR